MKVRKVKITPQQAWERYGKSSDVECPVEFLLSEYMVEGITDIPTICFKEAEIVLTLDNKPVSVEDIQYIADLLEEYIMDYINKKGGLDKLRLYNLEELEEIERHQCDVLLEMLGLTRKNKDKTKKQIGQINKI